MYSRELGKSMNHGQSFIPGRFGRTVRPQGSSQPTGQPDLGPAPQPVGMDMATGAPVLKQRSGKMARPRAPRTPLQQAILPQG